MTDTSNKKILAGFFKEIWNDGRVECVDKYLADTYTIQHDPGDLWDGQTLTVEGFKERLFQSRAMSPDQVFTIVKMVEENSCVAVSWTWRGTHLGDIPGFPATGKKIKMSGLTMYEFEGNRISAHWQISDRLSVFQQLSQIQ